MKMITVSFYKSDSDHEPVREWLLDLTKDEMRVIGEDIKTVEYGWPLGMPTCKPLGSGLYEVRSSLPSQKIAGVLFCIEDGKMILPMHL